MKQRLVVMNGSRIVQVEQDGAWTNQKVDKAGALRPGIYNLYTAQQASKTQRYDGPIIYADSNNVFQQIGKQYVMHARANFDKVPDIGLAKSISYDSQGRATVADVSAQLTRGRSR